MLTTMTEESAHGRRHMFKSKWGKILKTDDATTKNAPIADDVSDFLKGSQRPIDPPPPPPAVSTRPAASPRIDVAIAQRWPDAAQIKQIDSNEYRVPSPLPVETSGRARKRKGLNVRFAVTPPEIIGHGGDETATPPVEVARNRSIPSRSKSERRPAEPHLVPEFSRERSASPYRPGLRNRAQTTQGNSDAFTQLSSAGVFADRPPSRDDRVNEPGYDVDDEPRPGMLKRTQTGFSTIDDDSPPVSDDEGPPPASAFAPSMPARKAVPPKIQVPEVLPGDAPEEKLPSEEWNRSQEKIPRILRQDSTDSISKTQQRMRVEEGQAFARAYRLSQIIPAGQDPSRPSSRSSDNDNLSRQPSSVTEAAHRRMYAQNPSTESLSLRKKPSPSPNRFSGERFLQPSSAQSERLTPPVTPPTAQAKAGGLAPQDYIEFFKSKTRSRSNSAANKALAREQQAAVHDSPQQETGAIPQDRQLRVDVGQGQPDLLPPIQDSAFHTQREHPEITAKDPIPPKPMIPARRAVPTYADNFDQSPLSAHGENPHFGMGAMRHTRKKSSADATYSSPDTPLRKADPMAAAAFDDFASRVNQMKGVFRLTSQKERLDNGISVRQWLRCAFWWLHKGKLQLENQARLQQRGLLTQAHVDAAKSWWILTEIIDRGMPPNDPQDVDDATALRYHLQTLSVWMDRQGVLPPQASLIQGQDTTIWIKYPKFPPDLEYLLGCTAQTTKAGDVLPLGDTKDYFFYQRMFVIGSVNTDDPQTDRIKLPCTLSILRHRLHYRASIMISSQSELVSALVGPDLGKDKQGPTWYDIAWKSKSCAMSINLPRGLVLNISLDENDYRSLSNMIEYTRAMDKSFHPVQGESLIFSSQLHEAQYVDTSRTNTFPDGKVRRSYIGVFQDVKVSRTQNVTQKMHGAYRVMLITPSTSRTLGVVSHAYDAKTPFLFEVPDAPSDKANPAIIIHSSDQAQPWRMLLVFDSKPAYNDLLDLLCGTFKSPDEYTTVNLSIKSFSAETFSDSSSSNTSLSVLPRLQWRDATIITRRTEKPITVLSDSLRVILNHAAGTVVDRLNLLPGELLLRMPLSPDPTIEIARLPQADVHLSIDRRHALPGSLDKLTDVGRALSTTPTLRRLTFASTADLHAFEQEITGYRVVFDAFPSLFSITRRHKVVSIHKKLEATRVRVQVLARDGDVQIAAFFEEFAAADAMVFQVKGSDEFERIRGEKGARHAIRLVEAKFSLPKRDKETEGDCLPSADPVPPHVRRRFVNLEGMEYAEEHDDIVVGFEAEQELENFCEALPGSVHSSARNFLSKRRN